MKKFFESRQPELQNVETEDISIKELVSKEELSSLGIDQENIDIINKIPGINTDRIKGRIDFMRSVGIKRPEQHITNYPFQSLICSEESISEHIQELNSLGLDAVSILDKQIQLLFVSTENLKNRFEILSKVFDEKLIKILSKSPGILGHSSENILSKIGFLSDLGIKNPTGLIKTAPETLTLASDSIESQIENIKQLFPSIEPEDFIGKFPKAFTYSEEKFIYRKRMIERLIDIYNVNFSAEDLVSISPQILTYGQPRMIIMVRILKRFEQDDPKKIIRLFTRKMDDVLIAACEDYSMEGDSFEEFINRINISGRSDLSKDEKYTYVKENLEDEKIIKQIPKLGRQPKSK